MHRLAFALLLSVAPVAPLALANAQGAAPAPATASRPSSSIRAGTYDLEIIFGGGTLEGTLEVKPAGDSLLTTLFVSGHVSPVKPTKRQGGRLTLESTTAALPIRYDLEFKGDDVSGTFTYDGQAGSVSGRRRARE